jgi:hypothetical protein
MSKNTLTISVALFLLWLANRKARIAPMKGGGGKFGGGGATSHDHELEKNK